MENIDLAVELYSKIILDAVNDCYPYKTIRWRSTEPPWMNFQIKMLINLKDKIYRNGNYPKFLCIREKIQKEICNAKKRFYSQKFSIDRSPKNIWKNINKILNKEPVKNTNLNLNELDKLNSKSADVFNVSDLDQFSQDTNNQQDDSSATILSEYETYNIISRFKTNSSGPDGISGSIYGNLVYTYL